VIAGRIARGGRMEAGWIEIEGGRVAGGGPGEPPGRPDERVEGILAPGLCDLQVNGAGGREISGGAEALDAVDRIQLAHGVTSYLPTLISPDDEVAEGVLAELGERAADPSSPVRGAHVEGPFLSPEHRGVHPLERLRVPADGVPEWLDAPAVSLVTIAPELRGALALIARLAARGVTVSLGHSGAGARAARAAIDAGATMVTHVFDAMAPLDHREAALPGVALVDERVRVGVIADGVHVDPLVLELVRRAAGGRVVLATDSTPAAAAPPGRYPMAGIAVAADPAGGARASDGTLAGSTLTLEAAVRAWATMTGATVAEALAAASEEPAAALGLPAPLAPGSPADLVELTEGGEVRRTMLAGRWVFEAAAA
jgi:N-acetylglucosamine-6-phosphate deacetylase